MDAVTTTRPRRTLWSSLRHEWIPALGPVLDKLGYGGRIAVMGCGRGAEAIELAKIYPLATIDGFDVEGKSIEEAELAAAAAGVSTRCEFNVSGPCDLPDFGYDLVCCFGPIDALPDPAAAVRRAVDIIQDDGAVMVVEPVTDGELLDPELISAFAAAGISHIRSAGVVGDHYVLDVRKN